MIKKAENIASWIGEQTKKAGKKSLIIHWNQSVSSYLSIKLAIDSRKINNIKVFCLFFGSPISLSAQKAELIQLVRDEGVLKDLPTPQIDNAFIIDSANDEQRFVFQDMIVQATLAHYADFHNGLIVGTMDKTRHAERLHFKYAEQGDIFPLLNLYESECEEILKQIWPNVNIMSLDIDRRFDIEWAVKENEKTSILEDEQTPDKNKNWFAYTMRQKKILAYLHQRWKLTAHKKLAPSGRLIYTEV